MRLLTVGSLPPEWGGPTRGGVATFHASLLAGLLERRPEVEVVGVLPPAPLDRATPVPVFVRPEEVSRARFYEDLLEQLRPDAVLMNHIANTVGATHAGLRTPVPAIGVVHSWHNITFRSGEAREHALNLTAEAMVGMAALAVPSRHGIAEGQGLGLRYPAIVESIHNPLQPLYLDDEIDVSAGERRDVVYLGGLIPRKDPAALVEAAALLPGVSVVFAGEGELESDLRATIDRLALGDRVRLADLSPGEGHLAQVRDLLLQARLLCLPSRSESFGLAFIEALACGTPVVGFGPTVRELRDEMGIEIGEPLETGTPEEVAGAIERVLSTGWDRGELRRATVATFGLSRVTDRYVELLSRVVGERVGDHSR
jgi:glycosyltransferase involved in cell wall biosynthesis